jgi:hypothetical protein
MGTDLGVFTLTLPGTGGPAARVWDGPMLRIVTADQATEAEEDAADISGT